MEDRDLASQNDNLENKEVLKKEHLLDVVSFHVQHLPLN